MKELDVIELQEVDLSEFVAYCQKKCSPLITITEDLNAGLFNYFSVVADKLKLVFFIVKGTKKLAFFGNNRIVKKICNISKVNYQILGYVNSGKSSDRKVITKAYNYDGKQIKEFIEINVNEDTSYPTLKKYKLLSRRYCVSVRGKVNNKIENYQQLLKYRQQFLINGTL